MKWLKNIINISDSIEHVNSRIDRVIECMSAYIEVLEDINTAYKMLKAEVDKLKKEQVKDDCK